MADPVDFRALQLSVIVTSIKNPSWNFAMSAQGNIPPERYSIRGETLGKVTDKLVALRQALGEPPDDLCCSIIETWSVKEIIITTELSKETK